MSGEDGRRVQKECEDCMRWLDGNLMAEKEEYEYKLKEMTRICSPAMTRLHRGGRGESDRQNDDGPTIEEVD